MKVCSACRRCYEDDILSCSEDNHDILSDARAGGTEIIPNYRLDMLREADAASETYRAVNTILNKSYLIRIVAPAAFDDAAKKQFLAEAQALAALIHPNVARVFESGTLSDGSLFVVTEYSEAQTLRECFENVGKPSEVTTLTILRQAAEGLEALHAAKVLHRNIKPENIILTSDAENRFLIKLQNMDFSALRQRQVNRAGDLFLADLRYFSPEQCAAEDAGEQTDVYALGIVLYESLAGKVPFDAAYADALVLKQTREQPPEIKIHSFDLRMLLTHTLTDALQKTTRARLKTANAMARRLRHIEQLATHSSTPPPAMAYPAAMNKTAVAFTPPAKMEKSARIEKSIDVEKPVEIETPAIETAAVLETAATEAVPALEAAALAENISLPETLAAAENAAPFETAAMFEDLPVTAPAINLEEAPAAPPTIAEDLPVTQFQPVGETAPAIEIPAAAETEPAVEIPAETLPVAETTAEVEATPVMAEARAAFDESPLFETRASFEALPAFENAAENETVVEEPVALEKESKTENPLAAKEQVWAKSETIDDDSLVPENEAIAENAAEVRRAAPPETAEELPAVAAAAAEETSHDYSTTKLPPIEKILADPNFKVTEIETIFSLRRGNFEIDENSDIHKTSEPVLIEWEQPDDVPTTTAALSISKKQFADARFIPNADVIEAKAAKANAADEVETDEIAGVETGEVETSEVEYVSEAHKTRRDYASVSSVFASYEDSAGGSWNLPGKRAVITGAAICGLIVVAVGGVFLNRQMQSADAQTTAKSSPANEKTLPKSAEPPPTTETSAPAKPEMPTTAPLVIAEPDLPNYEPRETIDVKTAAPVAPINNKKRAAVKLPENPKNDKNAAPNKLETAVVFDKKGNPKLPTEKKNAAKNQASTPTKTDVFTRPRVVKNPKF